MAVVVLATAGFATVGASTACRHATFFRVRQVEVRGVRHLGVDLVLDALALDSMTSVCHDLDEAEQRLRVFPGVADVHVSRRAPGTVVVRLREVPPVAFVNGEEGLRVVDQRGGVLPYDPTFSRLDLPLMARPDTGLLEILARVQGTDPELSAGVTAARRVRGDPVLTWGVVDVVLDATVDPEVIVAVASVLEHLHGVGHAFEQIDARFRGQVVVRLKGTE